MDVLLIDWTLQIDLLQISDRRQNRTEDIFHWFYFWRVKKPLRENELAMQFLGDVPVWNWLEGLLGQKNSAPWDLRGRCSQCETLITPACLLLAIIHNHHQNLIKEIFSYLDQYYKASSKYIWNKLLALKTKLWSTLKCISVICYILAQHQRKTLEVI